MSGEPMTEGEEKRLEADPQPTRPDEDEAVIVGVDEWDTIQRRIARLTAERDEVRIKASIQNVSVSPIG